MVLDVFGDESADETRVRMRLKSGCLQCPELLAMRKDGRLCNQNGNLDVMAFLFTQRIVIATGAILSNSLIKKIKIAIVILQFY